MYIYIYREREREIDSREVPFPGNRAEKLANQVRHLRSLLQDSAFLEPSA